MGDDLHCDGWPFCLTCRTVPPPWLLAAQLRAIRNPSCCTCLLLNVHKTPTSTKSRPVGRGQFSMYTDNSSLIELLYYVPPSTPTS